MRAHSHKRRPGSEAWRVAACALTAWGAATVLCCPAAQAGSPRVAPAAMQPHAAPAPADGEDSLDDDRAEHWDVPEIAREGRVQSGVLAAALLLSGALSARRRSVLKGRKRRE